MEQQPNGKHSMRTEAIAVLLAVIAGSGIGYALWVATGSTVLALIMASPTAALVNNFVRNVLRPAARG